MRATTKLTRCLAALLALAAMPATAQAIWVEAPSTEDFAKAYPANSGLPERGVVHVKCAVASDGVLSECAVQSEAPALAGLGAAALALAPKFRATPEAAARMKGSVVLPIRFGPPSDDGPPRRDASFKRSSGYRQLGDAGPYYPERAARMGATGIVEADCRVAADNALRDCRIASASNPDFYFHEAFLKMAQARWVTAAAPPEGVTAPADGVWRFRMIFDGQRH